ncbi:T9SS type A sorting domain-containing protein [Roseivirga sp. BDSF3-8]|uniref:zinc-dependent metalloprotease n=1 Tax=Roseivirga sp. BDSF3-8 TaxID=3241598 RepID=UPI003532397E
MKKLFVTYLFLLTSFCSLKAQTMMFDTESVAEKLSARQTNYFERIQARKKVDKVYSLSVNPNILHAEKISFKVGNELVTAYRLKENIRNAENFSWFGKTTEGEGVFFYVNNGKVASKFNVGEFSYTLVPLNEGAHSLIRFKDTHIGVCGTPDVAESNAGRWSQNHKLANDGGCTLRVLVATTPGARQQIYSSGFDLSTFAQVAIDEANLAYISSQINVTMELAALVNTGYTEYTGDKHVTDVTRFRNGTNGLEITHSARERYQTDVQVLVRKNESGIYGRAFYIPTVSEPVDGSKAFCTVSVDGVTNGRFSFTHEVGHLQGGRHENHSTSPSYARGFLSSNSTNAWRTIMTRTGAAPCNQSNSCRTGLFSNPAVAGPGGIPAGTSDRDNARRINETSLAMNNLRTSPSTLLLTSETITSEQVSHHLGNSVVDTDNRSIIYQSGSLSTIRAQDRIILRGGTHIRQGAEFRAYLTGNPCESLPAYIQVQEVIGQNTEDGKYIGSDLALADELQLAIYPNPSNGIVNLHFKNVNLSTYNVTIYSMQGGVVFEKAYSGAETKIDVSHLKAGYYFIGIRNDTMKLIRKIIRK